MDKIAEECNLDVNHHDEVKEWPDPPPPPIQRPELEVDDPILVRSSNDDTWYRRHFSHWSDDFIVVYKMGRTSWTYRGDVDLEQWSEWKVPKRVSVKMLDKIPENWFLWSLRDERTGIAYRGDTHKHLYWVCELQHVKGGRLCRGRGTSPESAIETAIKDIYDGAEHGRWTTEATAEIRKELGLEDK